VKKTVAVFALLLLVAAVAFADPDEGSDMSGKWYNIIITNATHGQVVTPPVVIVHNENFRLFAVGHPAIPELAMLAEEGATGPLTGYLDTQSDVLDYVVGTGPLLPGQSMSLMFRTKGKFRYLTAVGMLAVTNDAFFAVKGVPVKDAETLWADAYDAGSEFNSESCAFVPGPPCGSHNAHDPAPAEGFVHIHPGIHGIALPAGLDPAIHDWRNPVVKLRIQPAH
jgi:hypothetical protein